MIRNKITKAKQFLKTGLSLLLLQFVATCLIAQPYSVIATTVAIPPVNPVINQAILSNQINSMMLNPTVGAGPLQVVVIGSIDCLSPSPFSISLSPGFYQQLQPVTLPTNVPVQITSNLLLNAFGNFNPNNLVVTGINLGAITDANNNIHLPGGTYRICFAARSYSPLSGIGNYVSNPNTGCSTFTLCTKASAPQFTTPANNFSITSTVPTIMPGSPVFFSWTTPISTCGGLLGQVNYDFEIHDLLATQTITDAINNPYLFQKQQLNSPNFLLDTMLYKNILEKGKQYVIRVRVNAGFNPAGASNTSVQFDNYGYSRIEAFQYGDSTPSVVTRGNNPSDNNPPGKNPPGNTSTSGNPPSSNPSIVIPLIVIPPIVIPPIVKTSNTNPPINAVGADCGITPPSNSTLIGNSTNLSGASIKVGEFTMVAGTIKVNGDGSFSGDGTIDWNPLGINTLKLSVVYEKIKINSSKELINGVITSSTNNTQFKDQTFNSFQDVASKTGADLDKLSKDVEDFINNNAATHVASQILGSTPVDFPIGLNQQDLGGVPATLAIMSMVFGPKGATMAVLLNMNIPEANGWLSLAGTNICVKPTGASLSQGTLFLPADRDFNIGSGGNNLNIKFKGCPTADSTNGTYVSWANNKLTDIVVHAEMSLPQNAIVPEDLNGNIQAGSVVAKIVFTFHQWDDWVASMDLPHFQIKGVGGLSFQPTTIFYDHSSKQDAPQFNTPNQYNKPSGSTFEGLYIKDLKVLLPNDFKTFNNSSSRSGFDAHDFIIDDKGVSTDLSAIKIIDLSTGNLGGWAFSLDTVEVLIVQNTFKSGSLSGKILLPISSTPLTYHGDLHVGQDSLQYEFVVQPADNMKFDIWKAYVQLDKNSAFQVKKDNKGTSVSVILNGNIGFDISDGSPSVKFEAIKFDSLGIANRNPQTNNDEFWFSAGTWSLASPQKSVSGFPISLNSISPYVGTDMGELKLGIKFDINLDLGFGDKSVISVGTNLAVYGKVKVNVANQAPSIDLAGFGIDVDSVKVKGEIGPVTIDGYIVFYKHDATFGDGLKGHVEAKFPMITAEATVQFGNVNNYNYWYVDACITLPPPGLAVGAGIVSIVGFGGGVYYNMEMQGNLPADPAHLTASSSSSDATPGKTMSGVTFVPKLNSGGMRATLCIGLSSPDVMNAKVTLTAQIQNGSLQELDLSGDVYVMTDFPDNNNATVHGTVDITYDFAHNKFNLNADIQASLATIKVDIPIDLYAGPDGWFFKLGDAFGKRVSFTLLNMNGDMFSAHVGATAYFMMGSLINPSLPDLPVELTSFGVNRDPNVDKFINSLNKADGSGFMFGARVDGDLSFNFAFLYAKAKAILGFDLALKNFSNFTCNGASAGWENWYALGQLYFYFDLDVGIHVDVWFFTGDLSLVQFKAGAVLSGGLPNPTWLDGSVRVQGSVLNGLITVDTKAHFTIGDKCYPAPDPLKDIRIISDYGPKNKGDVFDEPFAAANIPLNTNYDILVPPTKNKPGGETRTFRFMVSSFSLKRHSDGQLVTSSTNYTNGNQTITLTRRVILDGKTQYDAEIICYAQQYNPNKNQWEDPYNDKDQKIEPVQETTDFSFTTGPAPDYIPDNNIHFNYPVSRQRYVLKQEFGSRATIIVNKWQPNIMKEDANKFSTIVRNNAFVYFIDVKVHDTVKTNFTPVISSNTISYSLPSTLRNNATYRVELWSTESNMMAHPLLMLISGETTRYYSGGDAQIKQTSISGTAKANVVIQKPIYTYYFRTSQYNSFLDKINAYGNWSATGSQNGLSIGNDGAAAESFDDLEARGFQSPDGTTYPPIFQVNIPWDRNKQNDGFADNKLYGNAFVLAFYGVNTDFGAREIRGNGWDDAFKPVNAIDWTSGFSIKHSLSNSESGIQPSGSSSIAMRDGFSGSLSSGISMVFPSTSRSFAGSMFGSSVMMNPSFTIYWNREKYIRSDYNMMNGFGLLALVTEGSYKIYQMSYDDADQAFGNLDGSYTFITNPLGGGMSIPWNKLYNLYQTPSNISMFKNLRDMQYTNYPSGNRILQFNYQAGYNNPNSVSKSFNY